MASSTPPFIAACVQMRSGLDRAVNTQDALALIAEAALGGARFVATPEMTNVIDSKSSRLMAALPSEDALEEVSAFSAAAKEHGIWLLIGSLAVNIGGGKAVNRGFLLGPNGGIVARYDKLHMFDVDLPNGESWKESKIYEAGSEAIVVDTPLAKLGLTICYDVRFPRLYRELAQAGAEVICVPAAFTRQTGEAHWKVLLTARAIENGAFVVAPAQGGHHEDGRETYGHSMIIGPWGEVLAEARDDTPGLIFAKIDLAASTEARQRIPNLGLEQNFNISKVRA